MAINLLKEYINKISEIKIIGKDFSFDGTDFHFVGFCKEENHLHAVILSYNEELFDKKEQLKIDILNTCNPDGTYTPTVREAERHNLLFNEPILHITKLASGCTELYSHSSSRTLLENGIDENVILLTEFIRAGWECEKLSHVPFDRLYISRIDFEGEYAGFPEFSEKITLSFANTSERKLVEIPISLEIGSNEKKIELSSDEHIFIREVKLIDMYDEMEQLFNSERFREICTPEEIENQRRSFIENFSLCCPKGKYYVSVEYESYENTSVEIKLKSVLDSPPIEKEGCMSFLMRSGSSPLHDGMTVKTAIIDTPFDADTKSIEAEIFTVSVTTKPNDITV